MTIGLLIGIYAVFNNIGGVFSAFKINDPTLMVSKILQSLLPVLAGGVIIYVTATNLLDIFKKK
ncbi:hypothetical protein [Persephonella sp.]